MDNIINLYDKTKSVKYIIDFLNLINNENNINKYKFLKNILCLLNIEYEKGTTKVDDLLYDELYNLFINTCKILDLNYNYELKKINEHVFKYIINKNKIELPYNMLSLDKIYTIEEFYKWLNTLFKLDNNLDDLDNLDIIITPKLDGISVLWDIYNKEMYTRGDGKKGTKINDYIYTGINFTNINFFNDNNITFFNNNNNNNNNNNINENIISYKNILISTKKYRYIRGELILNKDIFNNYSNLYSTARNLVSSTVIDQKYNDSKLELINLLDFISYEIYDDNYNETYETELNDLKYNNIKTIPYIKIKVKDITLDYLIDIYKYLEKNFIYNIDGLVLKLNKYFPKYSNEHFYKNPIAFKFYSNEFKRIIKDIQWNIDKKNEYRPILYFEPIEINNKIHKTINGYNYNYLITNKLGINNYIYIIFSSADHKIIKTKNIEIDNLPLGNLNLPKDSKVIENNKLISIKQNANLSKKIISIIKSFGIENIGIKTIEKDLLNYTNVNNIWEYLTVTNLDKLKNIKKKKYNFKDFIIISNPNISKVLIHFFISYPNINYNTIINETYGKTETLEKIKNAFKEFNENKNLIDNLFIINY